MKVIYLRKLLVIGGFFSFGMVAHAQTNALWLRYPSISPDGKTIAFGYKGDIYKVSATGGVATPLIISEYQDQMPVWSHDGKTIAFASNRYGNFDVFTLPATGGNAKRLTFNSANDFPSDFTPDSKSVLFSSGHQSTAESVRFPQRGLFLNLYTVATNGGRPLLVSPAGAESAHYNSTGTKIVFQDRKGYEDAFRKHHISSVTRDIWEFDLRTNAYKKISDFEGEDREPVFSNTDGQLFYLNERDGTQNLYSQLGSEAPKKLTSFKDYPVRNLSIAKDNTLCFTYDGEIYVMATNGQPKKVSVQIGNESTAEIEKNIPINNNISEFAASPNGKEIAFISRGEVFVSSVENGQTKRITNTPEQERSVKWSPDGKTLIYAGERNGSWDIYKISKMRSTEPYFYASTVLNEEAIIKTATEEFQPEFSPDGKEIAYIENRNILKVYNLASKSTRTILPEGRNHSYSDGDWGYSWSPDSKWLIVDDQNGYVFASNISLIKADGSGQIIQPINSGFGESGGKWALNGKAITWVSSKNGRKSLAQQGSAEVDVFISFFDKAAYDNFKLNKDEFNLWKETETANKDTTKTSTAKLAGKASKIADSIKKINILDLKDLDNRVLKLTINSSSISDYALNNDGSKLFYLAEFENGYDLWVTEPRTHDTKILAKLGGSPSGLEISKDGKSLFVSNNGRLVKVDAESGKLAPIAINGEITLNTIGERAYIYEHIWRQVKQKFYDPKLHNVDWDKYKTGYAKFLPHISNNFDFQELLSELLGELNGSHTGGRFSPKPVAPDQTASLGILTDESFADKGIKITEILTSGPLDRSDSKIKAGFIIEKINGNEIAATDDWSKYLNRESGKTLLLSVYDPTSKKRFDEAIKTISLGEENELMYKRWVKKMRDMVDQLSGGKIGYVHVRGMDDASYRVVVDEAMGMNKEKDALIVDTRFNGGGWLHNDLNNFLSGKPYLKFTSQGNALKGQEPFNTWVKPSAVVMSEGNYSDAFIFPYIYKQTGTGKLIGMPVAGTGTAVWWETQIDPTIVFGIPMIGTIGKEGRTTENLQVEPDIKVALPYESFLSGKDPQIEAAVKEMLRITKK